MVADRLGDREHLHAFLGDSMQYRSRGRHGQSRGEKFGGIETVHRRRALRSITQLAGYARGAGDVDG
jgi:hypothetical protein